MKCGYRNCDNEFIGRANKLFCNEKCRRCEKKYRQRNRKNKNKIELNEI